MTLPFVACAQQPIPVVGFIGDVTATEWAPYVSALRRGLGEIGYTEGNNVALEHRWAEGQYDRLPAMAADLPVSQATKVEMIINLKTAKALGIAVPLPLLGRADEIIE